MPPAVGSPMTDPTLSDIEIRMLVDKLSMATTHHLTCVLSAKEAAFLYSTILEDTAKELRGEDEFIDEDPEQEGEPN